MNETNPYQLFVTWLQNTATIEITREIDRAFTLLQQHDTSGTIDPLIMKCTSDLEERDASFISEIVDLLIVQYQYTLPVYGIELEETIPLTHLRHLNNLLESILLIPDYVDPLALWDHYELANSKREIFLNIIATIIPEVDIAETSNCVANIGDIFFERFEVVIKPKVILARESLKMDEDTETRRLNTLFGKIFAIFRKHSTLPKQTPDFLHELRKWIVYHTDHTDILFKDAIVNTSDKLADYFDSIPMRVSWSTTDIAMYHAAFLYLYYSILEKPIDIEILRLCHTQTVEYSLIQGSPNILNKYWSDVDDFLAMFED